jgi:hypothetical protein
MDRNEETPGFDSNVGKTMAFAPSVITIFIVQYDHHSQAWLVKMTLFLPHQKRLVSLFVCGTGYKCLGWAGGTHKSKRLFISRRL